MSEYARQKIYDFIVQYIKDEQVSPSIREIGAAVGIPGPANVAHHLTILERRGLLTHKAGKSRTIRPVKR
jgi:repressor LexA